MRAPAGSAVCLPTSLKMFDGFRLTIAGGAKALANAAQSIK
jgi:hypothetical protein